MKIKSKKILALLMLCMAFLLSGCTYQEYTLQINDDNTCQLTMQITVNNDLYSLLSTYDVDTQALNRTKNTSYDNDELNNVDALFQELAAIYDSYGFNIIAINDTVDIGFKASKRYKTLDEINNEIKELNNIGICGFDFQISQNKDTFSNEYRVYGTLDYILDPDIDMSIPEIEENFSALLNTSNFKAIASISMPISTTVTATDGNYNGTQFVWTTSYDQNETAPVHIISQYKNTSMYMIVGVIVVIVLVIVGVFVARALRKISSRKNNDFYDRNSTSDVDTE